MKASNIFGKQATSKMRIRDRVIIYLSVLFLVVLIVKRGRQERRYSLFVEGQQPKNVWNLMADFRNIARLNTKIKSWTLGKESTNNKGHWQYDVTSHESMAGDWLFGLNVNLGHVIVRPINPPHSYLITSNFTTKSFRGLFTIENSSEMQFSRGQQEGIKGTHFTETVLMNCPLLLSLLCTAETDNNRRDFMDNVKRYFHYE